jgi:hypothetical protein
VVGERVDDAVLAGGAHVVPCAGKRRGDPRQPADRVGDDLHVQPVGLVLAAVVGAVPPGGHPDPVDPQQRPVEDHERLSSGDLDRLLERRCRRGEQGERLSDVAVDRRGVDLEAAGQIGVGLALTQVRHYQQGLAAGGELAPAGRPPVTVGAEGVGEQVQRAAGHGHPGRVGQHLEAPGQAD